MNRKRLLLFTLFDLIVIFAALAVMADLYQIPEALRPYLIRLAAKIHSAINSLLTVVWPYSPKPWTA